jgi:hypothetical protein
MQRNIYLAIKAQQRVEPLLDWVFRRISNRSLQRQFAQHTAQSRRSRCVVGGSLRSDLPALLVHLALVLVPTSAVDLSRRHRCHLSRIVTLLLLQLLDQLQRQRAAGAFVAVDSRREEDKVRSEQPAGKASMSKTIVNGFTTARGAGKLTS